VRLEILPLIPAVLYALLLVVAAVYDFLKRRIPNWTVLGLLLVFVPAAWMGFTPTTWASSLIAFAIALGCSGALYLLGWIGAGDSKLFSAVALFAGLSNLLLLFAATAIVGGIYALAVLVIRPREVMRGMTARGRAEGKLRGIPYGVAIAVGALLSGYVTGFLKPHYQLERIDLPSRPAAATPAAAS
jgi:prepilin peptidase CpaA